jgi:hypothetical protein
MTKRPRSQSTLEWETKDSRFPHLVATINRNCKVTFVRGTLLQPNDRIGNFRLDIRSSRCDVRKAKPWLRARNCTIVFA